MKWYSVRVRLTLWNVAVLAFVLGGFGLTLCYSVQANLMASGDRELEARARRFAESWVRRTRNGGWRPQGDRRLDRPPQERGRGGTRFPRLLTLDGRSPFSFMDEDPWDAATFAQSREGAELFSTILVDREEVRVFSIPIVRDGKIEGVVQVAHPLAEQNRLIEGQVRTLLTLVPAALLVAGLGGIFLTERALRPVGKMAQAAARFGAADLSQRLPVSGRDELAHLATTFNGMLARLQEAFQRLEQAYEQQRRFTADASHELRTPLARLKVTTSLTLSGQRSAGEYREALEVADRTADTMSRIVQDLLLLARSDAGQLKLQLQPVPLEEVLRAAVSLTSGPGPMPRVEPGAAEAAVLGDREHLGRLFANLLENAVRHTPPEGRIALEVEAVEAPAGEGGRVRVRVRDTGEGIPPEHLPHVLERFYRVDTARSRSRGGTGLGLALCQSIVQAHQGTLTVESEVGRGTTVTVELPRAPLPAASPTRETVLAG